MTRISSRRRSSRSCGLRQAPPNSASATVSTSTATTVVLVTGLLLGATAFTTSPFRGVSYPQWLSNSPKRIHHSSVLFSSVGDDGGDGGGGNNKDDNDLGDFLDPMKKPDSEDMQRAREYMSETSLPISFDNLEEETATLGEETALSNDEAGETADTDFLQDSSSLVSSSSAMGGNATSSALFGTGAAGDEPAPSLLAKNPYMQVVSKISPSDLIAKFTAESDPRVQEAVRTTILGLIGSLPKMAFETTSVITGQRLASLVSDKESMQFQI